jgi:hypothetical protein
VRYPRFHDTLVRQSRKRPLAYDRMPRDHAENTALVASTTLEGATGETRTFLSACRRPLRSRPKWSTSWRPFAVWSQIMVIDNLSAHKTDRARKLTRYEGRML